MKGLPVSLSLIPYFWAPALRTERASSATRLSNGLLSGATIAFEDSRFFQWLQSASAIDDRLMAGLRGCPWPFARIIVTRTTPMTVSRILLSF